MGFRLNTGDSQQESREDYNQRMVKGMRLCKCCKNEIPVNAKKCPVCGKSQSGGCLKVVLIVIAAFIMIGIVFGGDDSSDKEAKSDKKSESTQTESKQPELTPDEYKAQCVDLPFNDVMRNPDDYVGQKFKITVQISSASDSVTNGRYYKAYTDDGSGSYFDKMIWIMDKRDENADGYVKLLEEDIVTFYGEFNGLQKSENSLSGEKTEDMSLDIYYADIVQAAE